MCNTRVQRRSPLPLPQILPLPGQKPNTKLIIDLKGVKYIDSSGFGVFLSVMKSANNNYGDLRFCNIADEVMELFKLLQLHNIFKIYPTVDECINSFAME